MFDRIRKLWQGFVGLFVSDVVVMPLESGVVHYFSITGHGQFEAEVAQEFVAVKWQGVQTPIDHEQAAKHQDHVEGEPWFDLNEFHNLVLVQRTEDNLALINEALFVLRIVEGDLPSPGQFFVRYGRRVGEACVIQIVDKEKRLILCGWIREAPLVE